MNNNPLGYGIYIDMLMQLKDEMASNSGMKIRINKISFNWMDDYEIEMPETWIFYKNQITTPKGIIKVLDYSISSNQEGFDIVTYDYLLDLSAYKGFQGETPTISPTIITPYIREYDYNKIALLLGDNKGHSIWLYGFVDRDETKKNTVE